jgi:Concanavalin A-like lectin/glucanases superfamily
LIVQSAIVKTRICFLFLAASGMLEAQTTIPASLSKSVTLYSGFDNGTDAATARGDKRIYSAPSYKEQDKAAPGFGGVPVEIARREGLRGDALRFTKKNTRALFYKGRDNVAYRPSDWNGTVSFWLRLDPDRDLAPGFCDPIQITDKAYNDSAIWVDFTKDEKPRHFRLGIFGDLKSWNPKNIEPDKNPVFMERLVVVEKPPFTRERWTHVVVTWSGLNGTNPAASLYLNGAFVGTARNISEPFQWDLSRAAVRLGVNYVGLFDELAVFERSLSAEEIGALHRTGLQK